jgi:hypothetical protein
MNKSWEDDFLYGTRRYHDVMQKYCDYFKKNFKSRVNQFGYFRHDQDGHFVSVSNLLQHEELYLEHKGYQDDPHHVDFKKIKSGFSFDWPNRCVENKKHNAFRLAIREAFGTYGSVCVVEKTEKYYHAFWWGFASNPDSYKHDKLIILQDYCLNNLSVKKCLLQCKEELFPLLDKKIERKVCFSDLKGRYYQEQNPIVKSWTQKEKNKFMKFFLLSQFIESQSLQRNFSKKEIECLSSFIQAGDIMNLAKLFKNDTALFGL